MKKMEIPPKNKKGAAARGNEAASSVSTNVIFQARSAEGCQWQNVSMSDYRKARTNGLETRISDSSKDAVSQKSIGDNPVFMTLLNQANYAASEASICGNDFGTGDKAQAAEDALIAFIDKIRTPLDQGNGWKEAAISWEVCASVHLKYAKGRDSLFKTRQADFIRRAEIASGKYNEAKSQTAGDAPEWSPIETGPKDGTEVLLRSSRNRIASGKYGQPDGWANPLCWVWPYVNLDPTHWMPLPPDPQ